VVSPLTAISKLRWIKFGDAMTSRKIFQKKQGVKPCSKNCVDPVFPKIWIWFLIVGVTLLVRAGSSRDLDHEA